MDEAERQRRREEWLQEVRLRQEALGHESPIPAFFNLVTERLIDIELRLDALDPREHDFVLDVIHPDATAKDSLHE